LSNNEKITVGVLGCTGAVGQKLIVLLTNHPQFELVEIAASENSAGKKYGSVVNWKEPAALPKQIANMAIKQCSENFTAKILFSGLDSSVAGTIETNLAQKGHIVVSNSKNHRMDEYVPLVIPEINADHFALISAQKQHNHTTGFIITNPNCATVILAIALFPIYRKFGLQKILVTTMQAISGAGYPGVPALDILGNVIPYIAAEEHKLETELLKIFGKVTSAAQIKTADFKISAMCNRVPVYNGHTLAISFTTQEQVTRAALVAALRDFPECLQYFDDPARPQPLLDVNAGHGMVVSAGNLRPCNVLDWKLTALGHNTIRGAAGAAILNAEFLIKNKVL
jgi:aspartate-semialdehyde dehydrogenase